MSDYGWFANERAIVELESGCANTEIKYRQRMFDRESDTFTTNFSGYSISASVCRILPREIPTLVLGMQRQSSFVSAKDPSPPSSECGGAVTS